MKTTAYCCYLAEDAVVFLTLVELLFLPPVEPKGYLEEVPSGFLFRLLYVSGSMFAVLSSTILDFLPISGTFAGSPPLSLSGWLFPLLCRRDDYVY